MKRWQKLLARASREDRERIEKAITKIIGGEFPPDTIKLKDCEEHRSRIGDWRIKFHQESRYFIINEDVRRDKDTYKQ